MKIYTRTGDQGETSTRGSRVPKDDARVEAYGSTDELNCFIGQAILELNEDMYADLKRDLIEIQHELFDCGADLSLARPDEDKYIVRHHRVERLENLIDRYAEECPPFRRFILPGGTRAAAALHVCRAVCRRAERAIVRLGRREPINDAVRIYMNRLSDFFFIAARVANARAGVTDVEYVRE